jgi:Uma2 family endonuclease
MTATTDRKLHQFTVDEYEQMVASGIFTGKARVELLDGEIVEMAAMGPNHANCLANVDYIVKRQTPSEYRVIVQTPIRLNDASEPEPDVTVHRRRPGRRTLPTADDVVLVVEVADSTLDYDRNRKFPRYAEAGIPEAWLFDVGAGALERHTDPYGGRYRHIQTARRGQALDSTTIPGLTLSVDAILAGE